MTFGGPSLGRPILGAGMHSRPSDVGRVGSLPAPKVVRRPPGSEGYVRLPRRWVVERTFAWLGRYRRNSRDYERSTGSSEAMIKVSSIHRMLRLLKPDQSRKPVPFKYRELQGNVTG